MKLVMAIIRPHTLGAVQKALDELGIEQTTFSQVLGRGHERGSTLIYRGRTLESNPERLQLEIAVDDELVETVLDVIQRRARTGKVGDGMIMVLPVETLIRIRTGERASESEKHFAATQPVQQSRHSLCAVGHQSSDGDPQCDW